MSARPTAATAIGSALTSLVQTLIESESFARFVAEGAGARARVSEPLLPLVVAAIHVSSGGPLVVAVPEDAEARDLAEAVAWFLGADAVGLFASRGVRADSGLVPPAHLVGERARALALIGDNGLVCASALGLGEGMPPSAIRPGPVTLGVGAELSVETVGAALVDAGYARVARVEGRGEFAVRGGLVDIYPSTGRDPIRVDFLGDEVESIRAFSPFTQRTLSQLESAVVYGAAEFRASAEIERDADGAPVLDHSEHLDRCDVVWNIDEVQRAVSEELGGELDLGAPTRLDALPSGQAHTFEATRPAIAARGLAEAERDLIGFERAGNRVVVAFQHRGEARRTRELVRRIDPQLLEARDPLPADPGIAFVVSPARRGFVSRELGVALLPEAQVFRRRAPRAPQPTVGRALQSFSDLHAGDHVVHEDHGIGRLIGFETKTVAEVTRDYLFLEFKGDDRLYVPHEQVGKVSRYIGGDAGAPGLSKLGGKAWQLVKNRARSGVRELAGELLGLYAHRQTAEGTAYETDDELIEELEAAFPFQETPDQRQAIEAVKEDMESTRPMDRLVCGDVGFGKTEVAVRAAFVAAVNGRQTMVLAPTTVLAQQHFNSFRERYADLPVVVEMVSRFRRSSQVKEILARFEKGEVDVLIGTHRVLSRDVLPKQLGLVVVDEEQRFGVAQKELIRQLRREVEVLAMSATPIPRTLHMSLAGLRDISVIETPPEGRRPIRTHVGEYAEEDVREALLREHARGGQSFFLHNRVETIEELAAKLQGLCPELRFLVGHGQLAERQLEQVMLQFVSGEADVLIATTIIESGLDIPQANTLIVERADTMGLSQLYQLRGRVGRSDVVAHAYLLYPDAGDLSPEARARLATLADHTELGSGFAIAMRDLEIRGAGSLLGAEQSGHVAAVGFELYVELLGEVVAELSGTAHRTPRPVRVDAQVDAYIPAEYIDAEALKIDLHRRLTLVTEDDELRELELATTDRFGEMPEPVANLFAIQSAKLQVAEAGCEYFVYRDGRAVIGPLVLGSDDLKSLRGFADTAVYKSAQREVSLRVDSLGEALALPAAILEIVA